MTGPEAASIHAPMQCSILTERLVGLENQARGLAEAAGLAPRIAHLAPRGPWRHVPARFWPDPAATAGLAAGALADGLVIAVGGKAAAVGAALRRRDGRPVVQVQNPRLPLDRFDVVIANRHDEIAGPNVVVTRTALHRVTAARLAEARAAWAGRLGRPGRPLLAVLVGGSNGRLRLGPAEGRRLASALAAIARRDDVAIAATASRRTDPAVIAALDDALRPVGGMLWKGEGENPYFGLLAHADAILVTADSVSMVSEAAATAAPVLVMALPGRSRRIALFLEGLQRDGRIRRFRDRFETFEARPLDDTAEAAQEMRHRLGLPALGRDDAGVR